MNLLFVHQNFPGQFKCLAPGYVKPGNRVVALAIHKREVPAGIEYRLYKPQKSSSRDVHPWISDLEAKVIRGEACGRAALLLKREGFVPDVICANPGWGESLFLKEVWPDSKLITWIEFVYAAHGLDWGFDPEFSQRGWEDVCRLRMKNVNPLLNMETSDRIVAATQFQRSTIPERFHPKVSVIHEGIDTQIVRPNPGAFLIINGTIKLTKDDPVVTFVNRNLEPYRGFHSFVRAIPEIQRRCPECRIIIVGGDKVSYGAPLPKGQTYRSKYLQELKGQIDLSRVHFVGTLPYQHFLSMLQVSRVHVYLTYPFVLSWSMLEAMSCECLVVGSKTPPVQEVISHNVNGLLVDFFDTREIAAAVEQGLKDWKTLRPLTQAARQTVVEQYDLQLCLKRQQALIESVCSSHTEAVPPRQEASS